MSFTIFDVSLPILVLTLAALKSYTPFITVSCVILIDERSQFTNLYSPLLVLASNGDDGMIADPPLGIDCLLTIFPS